MAGGTSAAARRVAWVTGASRGVGRGIAAALGAAGWAVYVTARSSAAGRTGHLPGTGRRGCGDGHRCRGTWCRDRLRPCRRCGGRGGHHQIKAERGRLDLLVNNVWGGYERVNAGLWEESRAPLWEQPVEVFDAMFTRGVRAHYVALAVCAPMLISTPASLVVTVSNAVAADGDGGGCYAMAKLADDRLALTAALQLKEHKVASVAVHPGWVRTRG